MPKKRKAGRPPEVDGAGAGARLGIRLSAEMQKRLTRWRQAQPDKPGISEAVRRLIAQALKTAGF
jgi:hypothetical protein